jgi:acyl-coenzyme A thioesterase PaaI-like protein
MGSGNVTAELGLVVAYSTPTYRHYNEFGIVHGGYAATVLHTAMGLLS